MTYVEARRDALTGLANKRAFDEHLDRLLEPDTARPARLARPLRPRRVQADQRPGGPCRRGRRPARGGPRLHAGRPRRGRDLPRRRRGVRARRRGHRARARVRSRSACASASAQSRRGHRLPTASAGIASVPEHARDAGSSSSARRTSRSTPRSCRGKNRVADLHRRPRGDASGPADSSTCARCRSRRAATRGLRLLVVDDDPRLRILLRTTFEVVDIEVEEADSAPRRARADRGARAGRDRARRRHARDGRADVLPPAEGRSGDAATSASSCSPAPSGGTETAAQQCGRGRVPAQAVQPARAARTSSSGIAGGLLRRAVPLVRTSRPRSS